jgi:hypothetical protein
MNIKTIAVSGALIAALLCPFEALAQGARIQLDQLAHLADKSEETVDVTVDGEMLKQTAGFLAGKDANTEKLHETIKNITGIYVKSFQFKSPNTYSDADVQSVRKQVTGPPWSRIVSVREKGELTEIYFFREKDTTRGILVISAEPAELTVVNIVGDVNLASLASLGSVIPKLPGNLRQPR